MSRLVYFDCASGASGDMLLGALVDLGLPLDSLRAELQKVPLEGYRLEGARVRRSGLLATKVDVVVPPPAGQGGGVGGPTHDAGHGHEHDHPHGHSGGHDPGHSRAAAPGAGGSGHGPNRGLSEVLELLDRSGLDPGVRERSGALFRRLAEAEAAVHGTSPDEVHFHEVGAVDSILDIVGGVWGLATLRADRFAASPLNVGTGTVVMAHGSFPVPPPATERLVRGVPVYGAGDGELLTPTGALLVTSHATAYGPLPLVRPEAVGYGAGSRDTPGRPNVLRLIVGEEGVGSGDRVVILEAAVDDMTPQFFGPLIERLLGAGALDAYLTPIQMKKGRPGLLVTVLLDPARREALEEVLFRETTTLGIRRSEWERSVLDRHLVSVETPYGPVRLKVGRRGGRVYNVQPEFEDCERLAAARGVPVKEVWAAAVAAHAGRSPS